jgi:hypothetical protein
VKGGGEENAEDDEEEEEERFGCVVLMLCSLRHQCTK